MRVSPSQPYKVIYSLFKHEYLGYLFESFAVQLDEHGNLSLKNQNISHKNAKDFSKDFDNRDFRLIELMDSIQQDQVLIKFNKKKTAPADFFLTIFHPEKGEKLIREAIEHYIEIRMAEILSLLPGKMVFIMGKNNVPNWKQVSVESAKATVLFHFRRNEDNTHYFPTIKFRDEKLEFQYNGSDILCNTPGWLLCDDKIFSFEKDLDGKKLKPFMNKKFLVVPKKVEDTYYKNFIAPLVENYDVYAKGFEINTERYESKPFLTLTETSSVESSLDLFDQKEVLSDNIRFDLNFKYGEKSYPLTGAKKVKVEVEKVGDSYIFHRIQRDLELEKSIEKHLQDIQLPIRNGKTILTKTKAYSWLSHNRQKLDELNIKIVQKNTSEKTYFVGEVSLKLEIEESNDWFDIHGVVRFGEYEIPFLELKKYILSGKTEFVLPNGEIAVIPDEWFSEYLELFAFIYDEKGLKLKNHHATLVNTLHEGNLAKVIMSRKLEKLRNIEIIEDYQLPDRFIGELRPYQKSGYNWLSFLEEYNLGGCLADDMGLGKTVQTLALLQAQKEKNIAEPSLLILPTSLVYNWQMEAKKFCPDLKVFIYSGINRDKHIEFFANYDLIITTYGTLRVDIDFFKDFRFNYAILDESQKIKNPASFTNLAVRQLNSRRRLILTGTPIENSTMDLWAQMSFANPGLLGDQKFFLKEFLTPIEKKADIEKSKRLYALIKPFVMRRTKDQVAQDLPDKIENIQYCEMTAEQEKEYEETKSFYRNSILREIEEKGLGQSKFMLLQGLTKLRQIANHPVLANEEYSGESCKLIETIDRLETAIEENHKILVFSQFVKHLQLVKNELDKKKITYTYLDGSTQNRQEVVYQFQNDSSIKVFLISLKAGGVGLNLTAADYVFMLDPWWNPAVEAQAIDRAHRIGQKNTVFTYKFITKNTVEEKILSLQEKKLKLVKDLISIDENIVKSLTKDDIEALLE